MSNPSWLAEAIARKLSRQVDEELPPAGSSAGGEEGPPRPAGSFDAGVKESPPPPPPTMNQHIRAGIRAARREALPEDYE